MKKAFSKEEKNIIWSMNDCSSETITKVLNESATDGTVRRNWQILSFRKKNGHSVQGIWYRANEQKLKELVEMARKIRSGKIVGEKVAPCNRKISEMLGPKCYHGKQCHLSEECQIVELGQ